MDRQVGRRTGAAVVAGLLALAGCSSSVTPGPAVSSAISAAQSGASALASAANSLAASAESAASSALANVKGGLDAKSDISLGTIVTGSDGRSDVPVTVTNHGAQAYRYTVQVNFKDQSGSLLDTVIVNVPEVAAGGTAQAAARSNRALSGTVTADVGSSLQY